MLLQRRLIWGKHHNQLRHSTKRPPPVTPCHPLITTVRRYKDPDILAVSNFKSSKVRKKNKQGSLWREPPWDSRNLRGNLNISLACDPEAIAVPWGLNFLVYTDPAWLYAAQIRWVKSIFSAQQMNRFRIQGHRYLPRRYTQLIVEELPRGATWLPLRFVAALLLTSSLRRHHIFANFAELATFKSRNSPGLSSRVNTCTNSKTDKATKFRVMTKLFTSIPLEEKHNSQS